MKEKFDNNIAILTAKNYKNIPTEEQMSIFGTMCTYLAIAAATANTGDFDEARGLLAQGMREEGKVGCPMFQTLFEVVYMYIEALKLNKREDSAAGEAK